MIKGRTGLAQPYDTQEMSTDDSVWTVLGDMLHGQILLKLRNKSQDSNRLRKKSPSMLQGCWIILNIAVQSVY